MSFSKTLMHIIRHHHHCHPCHPLPHYGVKKDPGTSIDPGFSPSEGLTLPKWISRWLDLMQKAATQALPGEASSDIAKNESARVWGDPHFEGADGGKFDVMGSPGKTYNLFNDSGVNLNATFESTSGGDKTVVSKTGLALGPHHLYVTARPNPQVNLDGSGLPPGSSKQLSDGSTIKLSEDGLTVTIKTPEGYTIEQKIINPGINGEMEVKVHSGPRGVAFDGRLPGGMIGETFDADTNPKNGTGQQGEGALNYDVSKYEVQGGLFDYPQADLVNSSPLVKSLQQLLESLGITGPFNLPAQSPLTFQPIDWQKEIQGTFDNYDFGLPGKNEILADSQKEDRLLSLMMTALLSGNVNMAMMIYAHIETKTANLLSKNLITKLQSLQKQKQELIGQIQQLPTGENSTQQLQGLNQQVGSVNDDISMLQSFIKEVVQNKNQAIEFSSNFMSSEHQTTMSVIRSMKG